jgi:hypothetical protein
MFLKKKLVKVAVHEVLKQISLLSSPSRRVTWTPNPNHAVPHTRVYTVSTHTQLSLCHHVSMFLSTHTVLYTVTQVF